MWSHFYKTNRTYAYMYICIHENVGKWKIPVGKGVGGVNNVGGGGENRTGTQAEKEKKTCTL